MDTELSKHLVHGDVGVIAIPIVSLKKGRPRKGQYLPRTIYFLTERTEVQAQVVQKLPPSAIIGGLAAILACVLETRKTHRKNKLQNQQGSCVSQLHDID